MRRSIKASYPMWVAVFFLAAVFLMGGGARDDIQSLVILRPLAAICMGIALWGMTREQFMAVRTPLILALLVPLIMVIQLIPLPPAIWTSLPGRELYAMAAPIAGIEQPWRPISLVPYRTWNSLFAWLVPIAAILLVARLDRERRFALLPILIGLALTSGILGLAQVIAPPNSRLYLYEITNNGSAVGLFANRNHQATLLACLFPMLAVYASLSHPSVERMRLKAIVCASAALFVLPLILVTGSRAGLAVGAIGLLAGALLYHNPMHSRSGAPRKGGVQFYTLVGGVILFLGGITALLSRAEAIDRLLMRDPTEELRLRLLGPMWDMIATYFPFGTGFGTFPDVYKVHEPFDLLIIPYVNHAHNDLLEFLLEGGVAAAVLLAVAAGYWIFGAVQLRASSKGRSCSFGRLGGSLLLIAAVASIVDYPLRTPSISVLFAISSIWMSMGVKSVMGREGITSPLAATQAQS